MAKIIIHTSVGREFSVSEAFYGSQGPMTRQDAIVQMGFLLRDSMVVVDQGALVNTSHIVYCYVVDE